MSGFDHLPGGPSMMILIQRICIAFNGFGMPIKVDNAINDSAAIDVLNWKRTKFRMLWKMALPSSMAALNVQTILSNDYNLRRETYKKS